MAKFSVACNFDPALLEGLDGYPVYELYGKLTVDELGGGRPSFYLPQVDRKALASYVRATRDRDISFNYLLNSSATGNTEYTSRGQRKLHRLLGWLSDVGVDSVTVANAYLLRLVKRRYPDLKVRVSSHRFTDTPRKVRFWVDNGADFIVVSEVSIHREFDVLRGMKQAAGDVELQLIVNNWCRQDCAIAGNHAVALSAASRKGGKGFPLDYCSIICNWIRLTDPVNYIRANWIRPEDLHYYEAMGYQNFKIVERNTPTRILLDRLAAYSAGRYDGNLLDLVQNYAYPEEKIGTTMRDAHSLGRFMRYFFKPGRVNLLKFRKVQELGRLMSMLYPLRGKNPVTIDNRALDGFMERFETRGCQATDCDSCRYCRKWADEAVDIDREWFEQLQPVYEDLLSELEEGGMWQPYAATLLEAVRGKLSHAGGNGQ